MGREMEKESNMSTGRSKLSDVKRALLEKRIQGKLKDTTQRIPRRLPQASTHLSFAQQSLWYLHQLYPESPAYHIHKALRLKGPLDVTVLERSFNEILRRHEILRTTFDTVEAQPRQVIHPSLALSVHVQDLQQCPDSEQEAKVRELALEEARRPFDLMEGPLVRTALLQLAEEDHVLLLTIHHIVSDEWSLGIFWRELATLYKAFSNELPSPLSDLPIQYADYACWQPEWLPGEVMETQLSYWKKRLSDDLPVLQLPTDRPRPATQNFQGALQSLTLPPVLTKALGVLSDKAETTLFMTLLTVFKVLLHRYTGQTDIVVGTPIANRSRAETAELIGYFLNTLALRTDLSDDPSFGDLLTQVRELAFEAYAHQDLPFEKLVKELQPDRDPSYNPLFQVMFVLQQDTTEMLELPNLTLNTIEIDSGVAKFDLTLFMTQTEQALRAMFEYNTDLFDSSTIGRMLGHLQTLLEGIAADPDQRLSELPFLTEAEQHQLLIDWNQTQSEFPQNRCWCQLFDAQVERTPDASAVVYHDEPLSYRELNHRANQLAHYLRGLGVGPDVLVGIYMERSLEMVIGLLGVLKAGGAYVPLDAAYPKDRLAFILEDAQAPVLLTQKRLMAELPDQKAKVISLDGDWQVINQECGENLVSGVTGGNLSYVIYTSGSTGQPKGVIITHQNLMYSTFARTQFYEQPIRGFLLLSSFAFDSSVAGIFWTLCQGATLCIPDEDRYLDIPYLAGLIEQNSVSHLLCIPSLYQHMLTAEPELLGSLTTTIVAGEACPTELVKAHFTLLPETNLFNEYGPTETTVWSTVFNCRAMTETATVPIGRPIANAAIYVLDANHQPVPVGVPGELYIGGAGVARGYLNHPELTNERFIPTPFGEGRLYRTGDLAKYLPDGNLEFLGRNDHQVKIRGYRIELEEIEAALLEHPNVGETVVVPKGMPEISQHDADSSIDHRNAQDLAGRVSTLGAEKANELIASIKNLSEEETIRLLPTDMKKAIGDSKSASPIVNGNSDFEISLLIRNDEFINPPRSSQRDWLIRQALSEFSDDVEHLDQVSQRFVPGTESELDAFEISQSELSEQQIMETWQMPIMKTMAERVTETRGDVLEIGFGRGVSATFIQEFGVKSHTVVESSDYVVEHFYKPWRQRYPDRDIRLIHGRWQEVVDQFALYDGLFFHAFPLNEEEFIKYVINSITFAEHFFPTAAAHLKKGGIFTYLTTEIDSLSRRHQRLIFQYFSTMTLSVEPLFIPAETKDAWWADSMVIIKAVK